MLNIRQEAVAELVRHAGSQGSKMAAHDNLNPRGAFVVEHWRDGKLIGEYRFPNGIANQGKNSLLDIMFHGSTQITTWWLGMISSTGYTALAATDTYQNIGQAGNQWSEFTRLHRCSQWRKRQHSSRVDGGRSLRSNHDECQPGGF